MKNEIFHEECFQQFEEYFSKIKNHKSDDKELKSRIQGFVNAGEFLNILSREQATALMEKAHLNVFKMTIHQRKERKILIKSALKEDNSDFFNVPAINRKISKS